MTFHRPYKDPPVTTDSLAQLEWNCELDTPASVLVIGGGPAAIESALYARFLGYAVFVAMSQRVGDKLLPLGDALMPETWGAATSPLGLAALEAQGTLPHVDPQATVSYRRYVEEYLLPVAKTDLLYDAMQINSPVRSLSRVGWLPGAVGEVRQRAEAEFRALFDSRSRGEHSQLFDLVLDCSGLVPIVGLASGGGLAVGQRNLQPAIQPDLEACAAVSDAAGQRWTLVGDNETARAQVRNFVEQLQAEDAAKRVPAQLTWILPKSRGVHFLKANALSDADPLQRVLADPPAELAILEAWGIEALSRTEESGSWQLRLQIREDETLELECDQFAHLPSSRAGFDFADGLLAANHSPAGIPCLTAEPHYYLLGSKALAVVEDTEQWQAFQAAPCASIRQQVRHVFGLIGGRPDLDLYATVRPQGA